MRQQWLNDLNHHTENVFKKCLNGQITTYYPHSQLDPLPKRKNSDAASIWNYQLGSLDLAGVDCHNQSIQHVGQAVAKQKHLQGAISSSPHSLVDCHRNAWMENGRWNHAFDTSVCETHEDRISNQEKPMATSIFQSQDLNVQSIFHMIPGSYHWSIGKVFKDVESKRETHVWQPWEFKKQAPKP